MCLEDPWCNSSKEALISECHRTFFVVVNLVRGILKVHIRVGVIDIYKIARVFKLK